MLGLDAAAEAIEQMPATRMHLSVRHDVGAQSIDDSYNASPNSTAAALDVLMNATEGRHVNSYRRDWRAWTREEKHFTVMWVHTLGADLCSF